MKCLKSCARFAAMLAAVIVSADAFAQARTVNRPNLLNRNRTAARPAQRQTSTPAANAEGGESVKTENKDIPALNWDAAPVDIVLQAYADQVDKTYLKDPAVPNATITLKSKEGQKMTQEEYLEAIEVILEMNGIHLEPYGEKFLRVLPRKGLRKEGVPLILDGATFDDKEKVVSALIRLKEISTDVGEKILKEFLSDKSGPMQVFKHTNSILVTDTMQNVNRIREIMKEVDRKPPNKKAGGEWFPRELQNTTAANIEKALMAAYEYDKKRVQELNDALAKPEASAGNPSSAAKVPQTTSTFRGLRTNNTPQVPTKADSIVAGASPYYEGMLPTMPLILFDEENSPNKILIYTTSEEMKIYDKIIEQLDVPAVLDKVVKVYRLKYAEAEEVADMITDLINKASGSRSSGNDKKGKDLAKSPQSSARPVAKSPNAQQSQGDAKVGELTPENTQVLADKRINGLIVQTNRSLVQTIEQIIESMDIKLSQVLIETVILEVQLGDGIETGMDWVQKGRRANTTTTAGQNMYYTKRTTTVKDNTTGDTETYTSYLSDLVPRGYSASSTKTSGNTTTTISDEAWYESVSKGLGKAAGLGASSAANYYTGGTASALGGGGSNGDLAYNIAAGVTTNLFNKAFNFVFDSDELGITAILQATKTDTRSKYIASPIIMTLDNKEATIEATQMRYLFKGYQYSGSTYNGSAVPDYEQKELGITIKVTPKINPNGTVMLTLEEEYSQEGADQAITGTDGKPFNAATTVTRKMSADALLENNQTVIFAGLTETAKSESESGIPILKDIPWIGKWLFGSVSRDEARTELLVFMTPYVLDDAEAAQAEAIRRKRAISDQHAWDDHGWSASLLADPVSKQEQLRRLKEEWKKQDEEREAKIAIEQEKIKRVKDLEKMSKDERKVWLEMHKEELKEEEQEELEKKMLDEDSQGELKKLAEKIKEKKLKEADKELDKTAKEYEQENEYNRLKREREEKKGEREDDKPAEPAKPETPAQPAKPSDFGNLTEETK